MKYFWIRSGEKSLSFLLEQKFSWNLHSFQINLAVIGTVPEFIRGVLELAVREGDMDFINHLVTKQGADVNGELL